jgi:itaconyl-CoA hydratase
MARKCISFLEKVGERRYRESQGMFFEDFEVGDAGPDHYQADNVWLSLINMNTHFLHVDQGYASNTEFGKPVGRVL